MSRLLKLSRPSLCGVAVLSVACVGAAPRVSFGQTAQVRAAAASSKALASQAQHAFDLSPRSMAERRIEDALDNPAGVDLEFIDQPLKEAMEYLADAHRITILLDEKSLQDEGIQTDEPLNHVLSGVTLRSALNIMLRPLGLTYIVEDDVLKITTGIVAEERTETRVYDVRPLARVGGASEQLARTIRATIEPESWAAPLPAAKPEGDPSRAPGGRTGLLDPTKLLEEAVRAAGKPSAPGRSDTGLVALEGALVVTHNQDVHRRISALLEQLGRFAERADQNR